MTVLPLGWRPGFQTYRWIVGTYGKYIDVEHTLIKFRAFHADGQTSRNWDARFTLWCGQDYERARPPGGTDEHGTPYVQAPSAVRPLQPGDEGYVSLEDLAQTAREQAES